MELAINIFVQALLVGSLALFLLVAVKSALIETDANKDGARGEHPRSRTLARRQPSGPQGRGGPCEL